MKSFFQTKSSKSGISLLHPIVCTKYNMSACLHRALLLIMAALALVTSSVQAYNVTFPTNGITLFIGHTYSITWTPADTNTIDIYLCTNNQNPPRQAGYSDNTLVLSAVVPASQGSYSWQVN